MATGPVYPGGRADRSAAGKELFGYKAAPYRIGRADLDADQAPEC